MSYAEDSPPDPKPGPGSNLTELTVSDLALAVKRTLEGAFDRVRVRGELGRVTIAKSGHLYADLKDADSAISIIMWKGQAAGLKFRPEEGLEVVAEGRLSTYPGRSQYQLIADRLEPAGAGALMALLEERRRKLTAEGLFAAERKRPIPFLPRIVGVVTSPTGAVIRDILHRLGERFPVRVLLWPVLVQGEKAADQIAAAIAGFNRLPIGGPSPRPDVLIVARGGGSIEDLWAFNEEIVVRAAASSAIPLISAVGHETDTTLIDFAADLRAPTPTGAAEKAVPVRVELLERLSGQSGRLDSALFRLLERRRTDWRQTAARLPRPEQILAQPSQRLDRASAFLARALKANVGAHHARFAASAARLNVGTLRRDLLRRSEALSFLTGRLGAGLMRMRERRADRLAPLGARLDPAMRQNLGAQARRLAHLGQMLETLSHRAVLRRGYALVTAADGSLIARAGMAQPDARVTILFSDAAIFAKILPGAGDDEPNDRKKTAPPGPSTPKPAKTRDDDKQGSLL